MWIIKFFLSIKKQKSYQKVQIVFCAFILFLVILMTFLGPWVLTWSPTDMDSSRLNTPPFILFQHWLGTDDLGRDVLSRLVYGARFSLGLGFLAVMVSVTMGVPLGLWVGFNGGWISQVILGFTDMLMSVPNILLAIVLVSVFGPGWMNTILAVSLVALPGLIRVVRSAVLVEKEKLYVQSAKSCGAHALRTLGVHILPNCRGPIIVQATLGFSDAILNAAALGFLGLGVQPPTPEWGLMLADGRPYMESAWWLVAFPGLCILIVSLGFNFLGDRLRDLWDSQLK